MAFINRAPQGLLGLLDLKTQGDNPAQLAAFVQATLELRDFYALQTRATLSQASTLTGLGITTGVFPNLLVPQGELWLVSALTCQLSAPPLGAGETTRLVVGYLTNDTGRFIALGDSSPTLAPGEDLGVGFAGTYLMQPGDQPTVFQSNRTGGNLGVRLNIVRSKFNI